jgi:hypothetical protein
VGETTPTDPRAQRNRAGRRGGHLLTRALSPLNKTGLPTLLHSRRPCPGRSHRKPTTPRSTSDDEIKGTGGATAFHTGYEQATNSPKRELKIFTAREGGVEHVNSDDQPNAARFTADWLAETFATATA